MSLRRRLPLLVSALLLVVAPSAVAAPRAPSGDPALFLRGVVAQLVRNDYASAWRTLHPEHQRVAPLEEYVACESLSPVPGQLESIRVLRVRTARLQVTADTPPVLSKAVTLRLTLLEPSLGERVVLTHTVHAVAVDGRWSWVLPPQRYELYRSDGCGPAAAPPSP
jgi:hypothetical protein